MRTVFLALTLYFMCLNSALAVSSDNTYTHNTAFAVPELSFKIAGIYWLPDYLKDNIDSNHRTETAPDNSGDRHDAGYTCEKTYNLYTSCTAPQIVEKIYNMGKIICYKCKCHDNYKTTSCKTGWHLSGTPCKIGTTSYYAGCDVDPCPTGYTAGKTCNSAGYTLEKSGQSGDQYCGKCVAKTCPSGFTKGLADCNGKAHSEGWTHSSSGYSGDSICGRCDAKSCAQGYTAGLADCNGQSQPSGWTHSSNGYAGDSICGKCSANSCPAGYTAGVTQCSNTTSWTYGSNGYAGNSICGKCTAKTCASGFTAGLGNCSGKTSPAAVYWKFSSNGYSGNNICGKCTEMTCSEKNALCPAGKLNLDYYYSNGALRCLMK